ncbi:MAG: cation:proton antiporter [Victivallaceae bacterium]|jgi:NhaP-type Na+/H+ or K+/H+ antiporter|nr:cation:proton antiporter [Victivallaceae bacterium]MDD3117119.1 cation:proton antiporter [Victivallaceae bacterium]MDD3703956.1 cation:proton antiporter [Victivallaceae bacterium]MDD4317849.1 cation:proton antiporter [Victivallaceae bacterium]NLK82990.1 sodium:proton antiporter [Lentisphaerota bacterium]
MLTSLAWIFLLGMFAAYVFKRLKLPNLLGMLLTGILLGPYVFNLLDGSILAISPDLRQLALIIILARVGLSLDLDDLKKVGRPAILMCWLPATFEIIGIIILAPWLLGVSILDAAIIGTVVAAVSPAVIVPRMLDLMERGYGSKKSIPQLIMAGASVDDVFVIVIFTSLVAIAKGENAVLWQNLAGIPVSIITGIMAGALTGYGLVLWFKHYHMRDSAKILIMLSVSFLFIAFEKLELIPFSGLVAVICVGIAILKLYEILAVRLSMKFSKLWVAAEVLLFVLVGATVDLQYALSAGLLILLMVILALCFRMAGVWMCLIKTPLKFRERLFCMFAYIPKATVQAAIGAIPLGLGLPCGQIVITVAVISILVTAPLGAVAIDLSYKKFLADDLNA